MLPALALVEALAFVAIHLFVGRLRFLSGTPRSRWLSLAGGMSVAYVFLHLLPELSEGQEVLSEATAGGLLGVAERHIYLIALAGLVAFYGLERLAVTSRRGDRTQGGGATSAGVFRLHIASFALYNVLIGYLLLHRETSEVSSSVFFALAMGLHFLVSDYGLHEHHKDRYEHFGRWLLAVAVLGGWLLGLLVELDRAVISALVALLAGGVILNVMKEELPEERESRFSSFVTGVATYTVLLLAM